MERQQESPFFTAKEVKPAGWLKKQLEIQADSLSGNLDRMWPDVRDSRWIGGDREGWERVPYWLDGFIPLAWLLEDGDLQKRAHKYIEAILANQKEDGWLCPCEDGERPNYDVWALFLICKVLVVYHDCTGDPRIEEAVWRAMRCLHTHMDGNTLFDWAASRWYECLIPLLWLYGRRLEAWMRELAANLRIQGFDFHALFGDWRMQRPEKRWSFTSHVVNIAMSLKSEVLYRAVMGGEPQDLAETAYRLLMRDHGMACGHFTGDECLAGTSPVHGSELCSVVEAMYSYEWLLALTGDAKWADRLEAVAYNALPATISPDMWTHQYDQMTNQVQCSVIPEEHNPFYTNSGESHLFGLEPNFGCCTANFSQGWPKLALSVFFRTGDGLSIGAIAPAVLDCRVGGTAVRCELVTDYPFEDGYRVRVTTESPVDFSLSLRIPAIAKQVTVDGADHVGGAVCTVRREWSGEQEVAVRFSFLPELQKRERDLYCVRRGPLLFSLPIEAKWVPREYTKDGVERKAPYCDYELYPQSAWNYGFAGEELAFHTREGDGPVFSPQGARVGIAASVRPVEWRLENGVCTETPASCKPTGPLEQVELIPYGCTNLRMTEMPMVEECSERTSDRTKE